MLGTIVFFDKERSEAFIWSSGPDVGLVSSHLCVLRKSDFPTLWGDLDIGHQIAFEACKLSLNSFVGSVSALNGNIFSELVAAGGHLIAGNFNEPVEFKHIAV